MFERIFKQVKEAWRVLQPKCVVCNPPLRKEYKLGDTIPVCKRHLIDDWRKLVDLKEWKVKEGTFPGFNPSKIPPGKIVVSPLNHDLRKLLWEVRYYLQYRGWTTKSPLLKEGEALGQRLEKALKEQDLPSSPPKKKTLEAPCPRCEEPLVEAKRGNLAWVCPKCSLLVEIENPEEETRK